MCNNMSDVRLSNASPPLERVDARQQDVVRPPVCKNLFGTPDREEVRARLKATLEDDVRSFTERYNFEPDGGPLPDGNFKWTEVSDLPEFYTRPPHRRQEPRAERSGERSRSPKRDSSKKRPSDAAGLSSECPRKRSHSGGDGNADEPPRGAGAPAPQVS
ncbi:cyclin-dependent kinase inhibitor 1B-like isoform X2 [Syngnathoides biaculeatus]|uniref:cyclin-dependent kinase inhibitor 1B-like isoform X2 n=1 Tax=Syngnathoides biaculeatus TaxID=300417 RepID=UPI002ADE65A3|nr:cyclin-dependent kinase inhibitor 1B-like isoform X2 [Syngnathoides biaculeatus]